MQTWSQCDLQFLRFQLDRLHEIFADVVAELQVTVDLKPRGTAQVDGFILAAELPQNFGPVTSWCFEILPWMQNFFEFK